MRYSLETRKIKYLEGYEFLLFARKSENKYDKKIMETTTKTGIEAENTASKRVVQTTRKTTGNLIGNKINDKITSVGNSKNKRKKMKQMNQNKFIYHQKKDSQLLML